MLTRNLYLQEPDGSLFITPRALVNPETNIFDKTFSAGMEVEEGNDWMRWDSTALDTDPIILGRKDSFENTLSDYDAVDGTPLFAYSTENVFSFEDAPFEFEEATQQFSITPRMFMDSRRPARGYSTLTAAEQQTLEDIAMPFRILPKVNLSTKPTSPTNSTSTQSCSPSPEPQTKTRKTKKRKSSIEDDDMPSSLCQSRKKGHNATEKRYRTNLNDKIACLRQGIPPLWRRSSTESKSGDEGEDSDHDGVDKKTGQQKYGKAAILTRALEYIQHLEDTTQRLGNEVVGLKTRVGAFERLAMSGSIVMGSGPSQSGLLTPKKETLQSIQANFKQIKHHSRSVSGAAQNRRSSKKVRK